MFDSGARVGVIKSSSDRIKPGSIGYVCNSSHSSNYHENCDCTVDILFTNFTRYGHEKNMRCERKKVLSIIPILSCAERHFNKEMEMQLKAMDFSKHTWNEVRNIMGVDPSTPILLMAPIATSNINLMHQDRDFQAWANAVISQGSFGKTVRVLKKNMSGFHPSMAKELVVNYDMLTSMCAMVQDRHYRQDKIIDMIKQKDVNSRKHLIDIVQLCRTLEKLFIIKNNDNGNIRYLIEDKVHNDNYSAYAEEFSTTCFVDPRHEMKVQRLKEAIEDGTPITNRVRKIVNNISTTRDELIKRMSTLI